MYVQPHRPASPAHHQTPAVKPTTPAPTGTGGSSHNAHKTPPAPPAHKSHHQPPAVKPVSPHRPPTPRQSAPRIQIADEIYADPAALLMYCERYGGATH